MPAAQLYTGKLVAIETGCVKGGFSNDRQHHPLSPHLPCCLSLPFIPSPLNSGLVKAKEVDVWACARVYIRR